MVGAGGPDPSDAQSVPRRRSGTTIPPQSLRRALLDSMTKCPADSHAGPSATPGARGVRGRKTGARGRAGVCGRGRQTATSPSSPPPPADSPEHMLRSVDSSEVDAPVTRVHEPPIFDRPVESEGTRSEAWPEALLVDGEPTATGWGEDAGEDDQGDEAEGGEGSSSSTVYQRGATRLPDRPATREQRTLITPHGEK